MITAELAVTRLKLKGNWNEVRGKIKQVYGDLAEGDLVDVEGRHDDLLGRL